MSHDLRHKIRFSKPVGEHYDRPEKKQNELSKTPLSRQQILNDKKFYWWGTNQKSEPLLTIFLQLRRTLSKTGAAFPASPFLLGMILSGDWPTLANQQNKYK